MLGVWSVFVYLVLLILGWAVIGGFLPPPGPCTRGKAEAVAATAGDRRATIEKPKANETAWLQGEACSILLRTSTAFATAT
jgi:hypothetical protein